MSGERPFRASLPSRLRTPRASRGCASKGRRRRGRSTQRIYPVPRASVVIRPNAKLLASRILDLPRIPPLPSSRSPFSRPSTDGQAGRGPLSVHHDVNDPHASTAKNTTTYPVRGGIIRDVEPHPDKGQTPPCQRIRAVAGWSQAFFLA